jgi:hypothetical protein
MMLALVLALSTPSAQPVPADAVEAERAFAADAQTIGQWAAFRKWATADAIMFLPQPAQMQEATKTWPEPKQAVQWRPARSFVSCDGTLAANTGPWRRPDGSVGYFSTLWAQQPEGGWKWRIDGGDQVATPKFDWDAAPVVRRAMCSGTPVPMVHPAPAGKGDRGYSPDRTLWWSYDVSPAGAREFKIGLWNGKSYDTAIHDVIAAPPPRPAAKP